LRPRGVADGGKEGAPGLHKKRCQDRDATNFDKGRKERTSSPGGVISLGGEIPFHGGERRKRQSFFCCTERKESSTPKYQPGKGWKTQKKGKKEKSVEESEAAEGKKSGLRGKKKQSLDLESETSGSIDRPGKEYRLAGRGDICTPGRVGEKTK